MLGGAFGALLAGCGQKGPLFLPDEKLEELKKRKEQREDKQKSSALPPAKSASTIG